jgi:hypothetical protein
MGLSVDWQTVTELESKNFFYLSETKHATRAGKQAEALPL